jgi:hypothetical protein
MELVIRPIEEEHVTGMPQIITVPSLRMRTTRTLRRALGLEAKTVVAPTPAIVHCNLCGSPYAELANHFCPRLYGR